MAQVGGDLYSPIPPWDEPADKLPFHRQEGAGRFWAWLLRKRDPAPTLIVIADGGGADRRGLSLAEDGTDGPAAIGAVLGPEVWRPFLVRLGWPQDVAEHVGVGEQ